ncbi:hypothetical protein PspLS_08339, partial [Pyricularia sp. CBS 133598]
SLANTLIFFQVLFKRKPVRFLEPPQVPDGSSEVWYIDQTGEMFLTYEDYLNRMDFYKQRRFICQITGHSGLTFFDALKSELHGAQEVDQAFPESLKGPILRRVQFSTVSRIDHLVDQVFDEFKADYYPGESVGIQLMEGDRHQGVVREKVKFPGKMLPDGSSTKPYSSYTVSLDSMPGQEAQVDSEHIWRDRKVFTKSVLRSFIKKTVTREAWNGAPWLVKHDVAAKYHIDTRVPTHLLYDSKLLERKHLQAQKKHQSSADSSFNGANGTPLVNGNGPMPTNPFSSNGPMRLPELKPAPKSHKPKHLQGQQPAKGKLAGIVHPDLCHEMMPPPIPGNPLQFSMPYQNSGKMIPMMYQPEPPPPPPPPKYPIEDLQLESRGHVRPKIKFLCKDPPVDTEKIPPLGEEILMKSVGPLLETWDTLNVYCEVFKLDSFTFDDYVETLVVASEEVRPQLFDEIHCSILSVLVSSEKDGGEAQIQLPVLDDDEDDDEDEEESRSPTPEPEPKPAKRATRSSLAKAEAERLANEAAAAERESEEQAALAAKRHRAEDVLEDYDWVEQAAKRNFQDGGWERIMVGLLHQISQRERLHDSCEDILAQLVPTADQPTQETVRQNYATMDVNMRVAALQLICMLTVETKAVRAYMEECSETMTEYRKQKIELQRQRKLAIEELKALNEERKIQLPDNMPPSPKPEVPKANCDVSMSGTNDHASPLVDDETMNADTTEDDVAIGRGLRRAQDRAAQRQKKRELEEERKREKEAAAATKAPKQTKQFIKLLKDIQKKEDTIKELEAEIAVIDNDLREADCPRTRVLGKDRFWNRYYWFERNGMPYAGLPQSSTAEAEYANGCIWVQGPDDMEREGYIDLAPEQEKEYKAKFGMTVAERKVKDEGPTSVFNARQWGFISDPNDVKKLIEWLDPRGFNELKLRKELVAFRERIETHMRNRLKYIGNPEEEKPVEEETDKKEKTPEKEPERKSGFTAVNSGKRSTRGVAAAKAAVVQSTPEPPQYRCLKWENQTMIDDEGHIHSVHPPPPRTKKPSRKKEAADASAAAEKKGKSLGRQGTRYNF